MLRKATGKARAGGVRTGPSTEVVVEAPPPPGRSTPVERRRERLLRRTMAILLRLEDVLE